MLHYETKLSFIEKMILVKLMVIILFFGLKQWNNLNET